MFEKIIHLCLRKKVSKFEALALAGDAKAMYELSNLYMNHSLGFTPSESIYARFYDDYYGNDFLGVCHALNQAAAEKGYPPAMADEGWYHICGWRHPADLDVAFKYLTQADKAGVFKAKEYLYECYRYGWGTQKDYLKAREYLKSAAKKSRFLKKALKAFTEEIMLTEDGEEHLKGLRDFYN